MILIRLKKNYPKSEDFCKLHVVNWEEKKYQSDHLVTLYKLSTYYIDTYDFTREIENLAPIYFNDSNRLKNLRLLIIDSLNDKKLIEKLQAILNRL